MKCGDLGHKAKDGQPCQQNIPSGASGCIWHRSEEERHFYAMKGGLAQKEKKLLPPDPSIPPFHMTPFDSRQDVVRFVQDLARRVLTESIDARRVDTALRAAGVALTAFGQETQEKMVDALLKLEHGGTAVIMLERLTETIATGRRRPLPGSVAALPAPGGEPA
jgi:hypothetical protein